MNKKIKKLEVAKSKYGLNGQKETNAINTDSKYNLNRDNGKFKVVGHSFPDGYAIAIRQPIDFDALKEEYPEAEMPTDIEEDSIALDWRFAPREDGSIEQGVQLTIRTINGKGKAALEYFETQSMQYIMDMEKFEELFNIMKKIKKNARPNLEAYEKHQKEQEKMRAQQLKYMEENIKRADTKLVARKIVDTLIGDEAEEGAE